MYMYTLYIWLLHANVLRLRAVVVGKSGLRGTTPPHTFAYVSVSPALIYYVIC